MNGPEPQVEVDVCGPPNKNKKFNQVQLKVETNTAPLSVSENQYRKMMFKGQSHLSPVLLQAWDRIRYAPRTKLHLHQGLNCIWVIHFTPRPIAREMELDLGRGPNHISIWNQMAFGSGTTSHLGPGLNCIWVQDQIAFGFRCESHFDLGPNCIWVRN